MFVSIRTSLAAATAAALLATAPAAASAAQQDGRTAADDASTNAAQPEASNRRICVREQLSNTRIRRTICKTAEEWEADGGLSEDR